MDHLIIVDCQYDFIDGSLACSHSQEAVRNIIAFANANDVKCMYTSDWHSKTNKSFKINGGIWPVHCVAGSRGTEVSDEFNQMNDGNRPGKDNIFYKGKNDDVEEYSACLAVNSSIIRMRFASCLRHGYCSRVLCQGNRSWPSRKGD
jgi:nicotinamidase/pyrazinamidase